MGGTGESPAVQGEGDGQCRGGEAMVKLASTELRASVALQLALPSPSPSRHGSSLPTALAWSFTLPLISMSCWGDAGVMLG
jgi:hypothetical protein